MAGKTERRMALDCRAKSPGWPDRFSASHGANRKNIYSIKGDFIG